VREHTTVARAAESGTRDEHLDGASAGISIAYSKGFWRGEAQAQPTWWEERCRRPNFFLRFCLDGVGTYLSSGTAPSF
jgi:hypothetical protein